MVATHLAFRPRALLQRHGKPLVHTHQRLHAEAHAPQVAPAVTIVAMSMVADTVCSEGHHWQQRSPEELQRAARRTDRRFARSRAGAGVRLGHSRRTAAEAAQSDLQERALERLNLGRATPAPPPAWQARGLDGQRVPRLYGSTLGARVYLSRKAINKEDHAGTGNTASSARLTDQVWEVASQARSALNITAHAFVARAALQGKSTDVKHMQHARPQARQPLLPAAAAAAERASTGCALKNSSPQAPPRRPSARRCKKSSGSAPQR